MTRNEALQHVAFCVDDSGNIAYCQTPTHARLIGYQCGFEPMFVGVYSYLPGVTLDDCDAEDLARDALIEMRWFADCDNPPSADFII